jgi:hypothetical protein
LPIGFVETGKKERIFIYEKRKTAFIGIDMHKDIHVAVVIVHISATSGH